MYQLFITEGEFHLYVPLIREISEWKTAACYMNKPRILCAVHLQFTYSCIVEEYSISKNNIEITKHLMYCSHC